MRKASIGLLDNLVRNVMLGSPENSSFEEIEAEIDPRSVVQPDRMPVISLPVVQDEEVHSTEEAVSERTENDRRPATWLDALSADFGERPKKPGTTISAVNSDDVGLYRLFVNHSP